MKENRGNDSVVSVIIPTHYRNDLLRDAIESALGQTHDSVEVIVVDDSGEAHARPVVEEHPAVTYVALTSNHGARRARFIGVGRATGGYVQFLDDDDMLHPEKFEKQLPLFSESVGVVYSGIRIHETGSVVLPDREVRGDVTEEMLRVSQNMPNVCNGVSMLVERSVLETILPLPEYRSADDLEMRIELALHTEFDYVSEPLVELRRLTPNSRGGGMENIRARLQVISTYSALYERYPPEIRRASLSQTYLLSGHRRLDERAWSPAATLDFARAAYYAPTQRLRRIGLCLASLFGRTGVRISVQAVDTARKLHNTSIFEREAV